MPVFSIRHTRPGHEALLPWESHLQAVKVNCRAEPDMNDMNDMNPTLHRPGRDAERRSTRVDRSPTLVELWSVVSGLGRFVSIRDLIFVMEHPVHAYERPSILAGSMGGSVRRGLLSIGTYKGLLARLGPSISTPGR